MIAIIDYGAGNLQSVEKALRHIGCSCTVTGRPQELMSAQAAVLPGVGAFGEARAGQRHKELRQNRPPLFRYLPWPAGAF